jgi:hypothetical protein
VTEVELVIGRSIEGAKLQSGVHQASWGFAQSCGWSVNLDEGTIRFTGNDGYQAVAPVQVVGTFNTLDDTFLWAWDHPSIPEERATASLLAREFGEKHALLNYTSSKVECDVETAWEFAAVTNYLAEMQGVYRAPSGTTFAFLVFGTVTLSQAQKD